MDDQTSMADRESLRETWAVLSDAEAVADLREAGRSLDAGESYTTDEVLAEFRARRSRTT